VLFVIKKGVLNTKGKKMFKKSLVTLTLLSAITGCQTTSNVQDVQSMACFFPDALEVQAPQWVCGVPPVGLAMSYTGYAEKNFAGLSVMNSISAMDARKGLAEQFESKVQSLVEKAVTSNSGAVDQETTANVKKYFKEIARNVSSSTLNNSRIMTRKMSPGGGLYTLVGMDTASYEFNMNKIKEKAAEDNGLRKEFKDKKTLEALANVASKM
jgi:uncharacterized lipoprotein YajG